MADLASATDRAEAATSRAQPVRPPALLVMPLRAAEQHVLVVVGEADLYTSGLLRTLLMETVRAAPPSVLVELGALEFCDLHGLDALLDAARAADRAGVALTFRGMSAQLAWLHRTFPPRNPVRVRPAPGAGAAADAPHAAPSAETGGEPCRAAAEPGAYLAGRGGGRRGAVDDVLHAVPISDTTRSAVCGARVWLAKVAWTGSAPRSCPDCAAAVSAAGAGRTVHPAPASQPSVRPRSGADGQARTRQMS